MRTGPTSYTTGSSSGIPNSTSRRTYPESRNWSGGRSYSGSSSPVYAAPAAPDLKRIPSPKQVLGRYSEFGLTSYNDRFTAPFWWWLLDQSAKTRALWAFHHRESMDPARYETVVRSDATIPGELASLEKVGAVRDDAYVPPGIESAEWMTTPLELESPDGRFFQQERGSSASFWVALLGGGAFLGWFIFVKRWQVS